MKPLRISIRWLTVCFALLLPLAGGAVELGQLYEAEVEVRDQSASARARAITTAFGEVLVKVTGFANLSAYEPLQQSLSDAARYVQQYRYSADPSGTSSSTASKPGLRLWVRFDSQGVDQLIREAGLPVWGTARPLTLVWLAVEQKGGRQLVGANDRGVARELLLAHADRRALPIRLPLLDLTDQSRIRSADVWGDFRDVVLDASQRYQAQAVLVGRLRDLGGRGGQVRWSLYQEGEITRWQLDGSNVETLLAGGIDRATDILAAQFAKQFGQEPSHLVLTIRGVRGLEAFRRLQDYLAKVHGVSSVQVQKVTSDSVVFRVTSDGGTEAFMRALALGDTLDRVDEPVGAATVDSGSGAFSSLVYRLLQ